MDRGWIRRPVFGQKLSPEAIRFRKFFAHGTIPSIGIVTVSDTSFRRAKWNHGGKSTGMSPLSQLFLFHIFIWNKWRWFRDDGIQTNKRTNKQKLRATYVSICLSFALIPTLCYSLFTAKDAIIHVVLYPTCDHGSIPHEKANDIHGRVHMICNHDYSQELFKNISTNTTTAVGVRLWEHSKIRWFSGVLRWLYHNDCNTLWVEWSFRISDRNIRQITNENLFRSRQIVPAFPGHRDYWIFSDTGSSIIEKLVLFSMDVMKYQSTHSNCFRIQLHPRNHFCKQTLPLNIWSFIQWKLFVVKIFWEWNMCPSNS
jgi:hypothetical protein